jgi:hypothetical protein
MRIPPNNLVPYYEKMMLTRGNQQPEKGYAGIGYWWRGYPVSTSARSGFGALSVAPPQHKPETLARAAKYTEKDFLPKPVG